MLAGVKLSSNPYIVFACGYIAKREKKNGGGKEKRLPLFLHMQCMQAKRGRGGCPVDE
jgi:hypothetical protein